MYGLLVWTITSEINNLWLVAFFNVSEKERLMYSFIHSFKYILRIPAPGSGDLMVKRESQSWPSPSSSLKGHNLESLYSKVGWLLSEWKYRVPIKWSNLIYGVIEGLQRMAGISQVLKDE